MIKTHLRGLNITTMKSFGAMLSSTAPMSARSVTLRSKTFHPLSRYAPKPDAIIRRPASIRNTENIEDNKVINHESIIL